MLSDEEREAIEWLKRLVKLNKRDNLDDTFAEILLNLIEKQSKEIEELKEKNEYLPNWVNKKYVSKAKIKAKIEPVLKQLERKMQEEYNKYGISREYQDIVYAYNFLQSLLEKE